MVSRFNKEHCRFHSKPTKLCILLLCTCSILKNLKDISLGGLTIVQWSRAASAKQTMKWTAARVNNCWMVGKGSVNFQWCPDSTKYIACSIVSRFNKEHCMFHSKPTKLWFTMDLSRYLFYIIVCGLWFQVSIFSIY